MGPPPLLDEVSTECCCPERASFEPAAHSQREPPSFATVASSQRRDRRSPVFGSHAGADGEAAERVACRASRAHLLLERSEEHTSELQSRLHLVCRLLLEKKKKRHRHAHRCS